MRAAAITSLPRSRHDRHDEQDERDSDCRSDHDERHVAAMLVEAAGDTDSSRDSDGQGAGADQHERKGQHRPNDQIDRERAGRLRLRGNREPRRLRASFEITAEPDRFVPSRRCRTQIARDLVRRLPRRSGRRRLAPLSARGRRRGGVGRRRRGRVSRRRSSGPARLRRRIARRRRGVARPRSGCGSGRGSGSGSGCAVRRRCGRRVRLRRCPGGGRGNVPAQEEGRATRSHGPQRARAQDSVTHSPLPLRLRAREYHLLAKIRGAGDRCDCP